MGDAVAARQLGVIDPHAVAVDATASGAHEQRAGRPDEPDAEAPALEHEAGRGVQLARLVPDQVRELPLDAELVIMRLPISGG